MPLTYNGTTIGTIVIEQGRKDEPKRKYKLQIRQGNCLAVIIYVYKDETCTKRGECIHQLYLFYHDERHCKNILKNGDKMLFGETVKKIELNLYYSECKTLLKYFTLSGYKVTCFYKKPKNVK